jgi:dynein heavy chain
VVVPRLKVAPEHFIVSATGVMVVQNGAQAEFTPLAQWARHKALFDLTTRIGYFRNYLTGRCFRRWVKVRGAVPCRRRGRRPWAAAAAADAGARARRARPRARRPAAQGVRRKNFALVRERLQQRLFLAKPTFAGHLRRALALVAELREVPLAAASLGHLVSLPEFSELQAATREQKAKPMLESVVERLQKVRPLGAGVQ